MRSNRSLEQFVDILPGTASPVGDIGQLVQASHHILGAYPARRAESATFVSEEAGKIAGHFEHVTGLIKHHEGARGRYIFEADAPPEFEGGQANARWTTDLYRLRLAGSAVLQDLFNACAERVFVQAGPITVAADRVDFCTGRFGRANAGPARSAVCGYVDDRADGLNIGHNGRLAAIALFNGEGRSDSRGAALALERFDQRRVFAADVSAGANVNTDIEIKAWVPGCGPNRRFARFSSSPAL